ncbi:class F sortase [Streptomyces sp. NPDC052682]|uniref:class F sortase n=1 Tax=Streptomyces sp. NPDC052682 TaxID=3154954 RepID=UPI00341A3990
MAANPPAAPDDDPQPTPRRPRRGVAALFWGAVALVLAVHLLGGRDGSPESDSAPYAPPAAVTEPLPRTDASRGADDSRQAEPFRRTDETATGKQLPRSRPTRLVIPKIAVDAPFTDLALNRTGQLEPPPAHDTNLVGWYAEGASPGERGTSIIAGHVDTMTSAAVFVRLVELKKGDTFHVLRADGKKATFRVYHTESFAKDRFPDDRVYADADRAEVRLITCAGAYDRQARDYTENLVVFAHLI